MDTSCLTPDNPFVGLRPFESNEAQLFFGRTEQTTELLQRLHQNHFLAVVGSSGCGKSSLIRAGLIPHLKAGMLVGDRDRWLIATMKPGDHPGGNLAVTLTCVLPEKESVSQESEFEEAILTEGLTAITERLSPALNVAEANLLLLVDQFEEIFRFSRDDGDPKHKEEASDFVALMLALAEQRVLPIYVVMTMRTDFLGNCDAFYGLPEALNCSQYLVPRLSRKQRREAIEGPVRLYGQTITPRLIDRILNDMGDESDQLPVMQHAMMRIWEYWQQDPAGPLDIIHYEAEPVGTIKYALSRHADQALEGMNDEELKLTEKIFKVLTDIDSSNRRIRRPARLSDIEKITGSSREKILEIIERFSSGGRCFLVKSEDRKKKDFIIDISHESLIRQWEKLKDWVDEEAEDGSSYNRIVGAALYQDKGGGLLQDPDLQLALNWWEKSQPNEVWAKRYLGEFDKTKSFLQRSEKAHDTQQGKKKLKRLALSIAAILFIAIMIGTIWSLDARNDAEKARKEADKARDKAEMARIEADTARDKAETARTEEVKARREAEEARIEADKARREAEIAANEEGIQRKNAEASAKEAREKRILAEKWMRRAEARQLSEQSSSARETFPQRSLLLAVAGIDRTLKTDGIIIPAAEQSLIESLSMTGGIPMRNHEMEVSSVAFSSDGRRIASWSKDRTVRLWSVEDPKAEPVVLRGHEGLISPVLSVALSPDGKRIASGSINGMVQIWDLENSKAEPVTRKGHEGFVSSVAFSPDGRNLASGSEDRTVRIWNVEDPKAEPVVLGGHEGSVSTDSSSFSFLTIFSGASVSYVSSVSSIAFSPDGKRIASGNTDGTVRLWSVEDQKAKPVVLRGHDLNVTCVAFSPDGKRIASGNTDGTVRLWSVEDPTTGPVVLRGHENRVISVAFSPDGKWIASGSQDRTVRLWSMGDPTTGPVILRGHEHNVTSVAFSPDSKRLASGSQDSTVRLWSVEDPKAGAVVLRGHENWVDTVAFSHDGKRIASGSEDKTVRLWNIENLKAEPVILKGHQHFVTSVAFSPDDKRIASGSQDRTVRIWSLEDRTAVPVVLRGHEESVTSVAFSPHGKRIASGGQDRTVRIWNIENLKAEPVVLKGHENRVTSVAFSPDDGKWLASGSDDKTVRLWSLENPKAVPVVLRGHESAVSSVAFSPDGKMIASGGQDRTVRIWSVEDPTAVPVVLRGHEGFVSSVAFSPHGKRIASGGQDRTVRIWSVEDPTAWPVVLRGYEGFVSSVAFSPDGKRLASGSQDRTVRIWSLDVDTLRTKACDVAGRNLNCEEWQRYFGDEPYSPICPDILPYPKDCGAKKP